MAYQCWLWRFECLSLGVAVFKFMLINIHLEHVCGFVAYRFFYSTRFITQFWICSVTLCVIYASAVALKRSLEITEKCFQFLPFSIYFACLR
jgi:hypothetical protein